MRTPKNIIIFFILFFFFSLSLPALAQERIPDLRGKWRGSTYLALDAQKFHTSKNMISLNILQQSGLTFSGNIELQDHDVTRMRNFSGFLNEREGYIWYFCVVIEGGEVNVGYLITKNLMKIHLKNFHSNSSIVVCRLSKEKTIAE